KKKSTVYEDEITKMLRQAANAMEEMYRDRKEDLEQVRWEAEQVARNRAAAINESRMGFLNI
ncbi:MAG: hypothetical protein IKE40_02755, partial [Firmicutes bacterium]|nr:hypothetical protein [Bacillota bacterium]